MECLLTVVKFYSEIQKLCNFVREVQQHHWRLDIKDNQIHSFHMGSFSLVERSEIWYEIIKEQLEHWLERKDAVMSKCHF